MATSQIIMKLENPITLEDTILQSDSLPRHTTHQPRCNVFFHGPNEKVNNPMEANRALIDSLWAVQWEATATERVYKRRQLYELSFCIVLSEYHCQ